MTTEIKELREQYKTVFGNYPSPAAKEETIIKKLEKEGVVFKKDEPGQEQVVKPAAKMTEDVPETPVSRGLGAHREFLVYFRGTPKWWSAASIQTMRAYAKDIQFPEGTDYTGVSDFNKCKTC
jgi:hypothetical protein